MSFETTTMDELESYRAELESELAAAHESVGWLRSELRALTRHDPRPVATTAFVIGALAGVAFVALLAWLS